MFPEDYEGKVRNPLLKQAGVDPALVRALASWHVGAAFKTRVAMEKGVDQVVRVLAGAAPGDPLADVVFALCFSMFLEDLAGQLKHILPSAAIRGLRVFATEVADQEVDLTLGTPAFLDDFLSQ